MATFNRRISVSLGAGKSGLVGTLAVRIVEQDGTVRLARTTAGISELAGNKGNYVRTVAWDTAWETGEIIWDDDDSAPTFEAVEDYRREPLVDADGKVTAASSGGGGRVDIISNEASIQ